MYGLDVLQDLQESTYATITSDKDSTKAALTYLAYKLPVTACSLSPAFEWRIIGLGTLSVSVRL